MNKRIIKTQTELDAIRRIEKDEEVIIESPSELTLNANIEVFGILNVQCKLKCIYLGRIVARENSSVVARENSSVEARENSSVEAWGNSSVVARENSSVVAWGNSSVVARENSSVVARGNSSVVAWGNSSVEAWGNSVVRLWQSIKSISLFNFSVAFVPFGTKINIKAEKTCLIQTFKPIDCWFKRNGLQPDQGKYILFKRVSSAFKTQENTKNETSWPIGKTITHPAWCPDKDECGEGKFHACSRPYFCDEFRNEKGDKYIAMEIQKTDLYEWKTNPQYPHKIGFRKGKVLYECGRFGRKINQ